ncbi:hypothetical protein, partial [Acinetobacter nosocomialis]
MNFNFFFNDNSKFLTDFDQAMIPVIINTFKGIVNLGECREDKYILYADNVNNLMEIKLANNYTLHDFFELCIEEYPEIAFFLAEISDKSPLIDHINEEDFDILTRDTFYIEDEVIDNITPLAFSGLFNIYLLSLNTKSIWSQSEIIVSKLDENFQYGAEKLNIQNISSTVNSLFFKQLFNSIDINN